MAQRRATRPGRVGGAERACQQDRAARGPAPVSGTTEETGAQRGRVWVELASADQDPATRPRLVVCCDFSSLRCCELRLGGRLSVQSLYGQAEQGPSRVVGALHVRDAQLGTVAQPQPRLELGRDPVVRHANRFWPDDELSPMQHDERRIDAAGHGQSIGVRISDQAP